MIIQKILKKRKVITATMLVMFLNTVIYPSVALALTSGPAQPEFSSFEPVATTNMVQEFTGDFTYNLPVLSIPGPNGGGYALSLSYHSGASVEEEASWVGYGWSLNPGAINRGKQGIPDDWNGETVRHHSKTIGSKTVSVGGSASLEFFSYDPGLNANASLHYNNHKGFGYAAGAGVSVGSGVVSLGYNVSDGEGSWSLSVNPAALLKNQENRAKKREVRNMEEGDCKDEAIDGLRKEYEAKGKKGHADIASSVNLFGSGYGIFDANMVANSVQAIRYFGTSSRLAVGADFTPSGLEAGLNGKVFGSFSTQDNEENSDHHSYGYMYSQNAPESIEDDKIAMDYGVEQEHAYKKKDKFLAVPFTFKDVYGVSGEGLSGGFKSFADHAGVFHPDQKQNTTVFANIGVELNVGLSIGGGGNGGAGSQVLTTMPWVNTDIDGASYRFAGLHSSDEELLEAIDEPVHFRFQNDLGGALITGNDDQLESATLTNVGSNVNENYEYNINGIHSTYNSELKRSRSSEIGFNRNKDMMSATAGWQHVKYRSYTKRPELLDVTSYINRNGSVADHIGEYSVVNEDGNRYNYSLPVYTRAETSLTYDMNSDCDMDGRVGIKPASSENRIKIGTETTEGEGYAISYLLTEITTPDYVDLTNDGPSSDDFGGYTKFNYTRQYGSSVKDGPGNWYKWRTPYMGLAYGRGELSNPKDDMGSVSFGQKEIYYVESIETKTHIAVFHTSQRNDGYGAITDEAIAQSHYNAFTNGANNPNQTLRKLDKIDLYKKGENGQPDELIQTIHFDYDYSLCPNVINNSFQDNSVNSGKLTLRKVWFEYNGVVSAKVAPYEFDYEYPDVIYPAPYGDFSMAGVPNQNPAYNMNSIDAWGNYQPNGASRFNNMRPWLDQTIDESDFDPAAWQLKRIKLPSGGEIHVQYEQDEYMYVQDKRAHAMVSLESPCPGGCAEDDYDDHNDAFWVDLNDMNIDATSATEVEELRALIENIYITHSDENRMYYKFLYRLLGDEEPEINQCKAEFVDGYAKVSAVEKVLSNGVYRLWIKLGSNEQNIPYKVCMDYVESQRNGNIPSGDSCNPEEEITDGNSPKDIIMNFLNFIAVTFTNSSQCKRINEQNSYLKLPVVNAKKGGGVRVKRILMYDNGQSTDGVPVVYGSEYVYDQLINGKVVSTGVAANEPNAIREENVLTSFLPLFEQSYINKIIAGEDKREAEGPIGESVLPSANVGYERVAIKSIHSGETNTGYQVQSFYTARQFPVTHDMTEVTEEREYLPFVTGLINRVKNNSWATQGHIFFTNSMHGQLASTATYMGDYAQITDPANGTLVAMQSNEYFAPGEDLPVVHGVNADYTGQVGQQYFNTSSMPLGQETEVTMASNCVRDVNDDIGVETDVDIGFFGIIPAGMVSFLPTVSFNETSIQTHVTSKIVSYPTVLKSSTVYKDGVYHHTENAYFSPKNGKPLIVDTWDGHVPYQVNNGSDLLDLAQSENHKGNYRGYTIPGWMNYASLSQKSQTDRKLLKTDGPFVLKKKVMSGQATVEVSSTDGSSICGLLGNITPGDLIKLYFQNGNASSNQIYHVKEINGNTIKLLKTNYITAADVSAGNNLNVHLEILSTAKTNQLSTSIASYATYYGKESTPPAFSYTAPAELALRQQFANLLNSNFPNGTITPQSSPILANLNLGLAGQACGPMPQDYYIKITNGVISVMQDMPGSNIVVVGTPASPHPMVTALNTYLSTFYGFGLTVSVAANQLGSSCSAGTNLTFQDVLNTNSAVATMRAQQNTQLTAMFQNVNGVNHTIGDFFVDDGVALGRTNTLKTGTTSRRNMRVRLNRIGTTDSYGCNTNCSPSAAFCYGCNDKNIPSSNCVKWANQTVNTIGAFEETTDGYLAYSYYKNVGNQSVKTTCTTNIRFYRLAEIPDVEKCKVSMSLPTNGHFEVNAQTGMLEFYTPSNECFPTTIDCVTFCSSIYPTVKLSNVVASSAITLNDNWLFSDDLVYASTSPYNDYECGKRGKWRQDASYSFKTDPTGLANDNSTLTQRNYNSGMYDLELFNHQYQDANSNKWLQLSKVLAYSPDGNALEEENILGIKSSAKYGYHGMLPILVAQNSEYDYVKFESFENVYNYGGAVYEDNVLATTATASEGGHSGKQCAKLNQTEFVVDQSVFVNEHLRTKGLSAKAWVRVSNLNTASVSDGLRFASNAGLSSEVSANFKHIAQVGEWHLIEASLNPASLMAAYASGDEIKLSILVDAVWLNQALFMDDLRIQPTDAQVMTYVYDNATFRLLASFDDQHFGLFYQYNGEGKLVRKLKETERGMKTIAETQYNTPLIDRPTE